MFTDAFDRIVSVCNCIGRLKLVLRTRLKQGEHHPFFSSNFILFDYLQPMRLLKQFAFVCIIFLTFAIMVNQSKKDIKKIAEEGVKPEEVMVETPQEPTVVVADEVVETDQATGSNEPALTPTKPTKKVVDNHIQVQFPKDAKPSEIYMQDVKNATKNRQTEMMKEMMDEMKDLAIKYSYIKNLHKGDKSVKTDADVFKNIEIHKEGITEPFVMQVNTKMTWAGLRDECARHFKIPKKSWGDYTLITECWRKNCLESSRATVGGEKSIERGIAVDDLKIYHFVKYD